MLVVIPFFAGDAWLAEKNLLWCLELDGSVQHRCVLSYEKGTPKDEIRFLADQYFKGGVEEFTYLPWAGDQTWPNPQNNAFKCWMWNHYTESKKKPVHDREAFLWWETDATPLQEGWIDTLEKEYMQCGKPFMGPHVMGQVPETGHMNGQAIYPWNPTDHSQYFGLDSISPNGDKLPWDVATGQDLFNKGKVHPANHLMQHVWNVGDGPATFPTKKSISGVVRQGVVLFHRCKDGSLIDRVRGGVFGGAMAQKLSRPHPINRSRACIVCLGRNGDIINAMPIAKLISRRCKNKPVDWLVGQSYESLLEGASYIRPIPFAGEIDQLPNAIRQAQASYREVIVPQVYANPNVPNRTTESFCKEAWRVAGHLASFDSEVALFDNRDAKREKALTAQYRASKRPLLLVNMSGISSPFEGAVDLQADIFERWGDILEIVDIAPIRAQRLYDLLGLMDEASLLVTTDTATLHLAQASKVPMLSLISDSPDLWHGSIPKASRNKSIRYREWRARRQEIHETIQRACGLFAGPGIVHFYSAHRPADPEGQRRYQMARSSWQGAYMSKTVKPLPIFDGQLPRMFEDDGGRQLPYINDLWWIAYDHSKEGDILVFTNTDNGFYPLLPNRVAGDIGRRGLGYAHRVDFQRLDHAPTNGAGGNVYVGADLFACRREEWPAIAKEFPDMLLGAEGWDAILKEIFNARKAHVWNDLIWHERHPSRWEAAENRYTLKSQLFARGQAKKWLVEHGIDSAPHGL